MSTHDSSTYLNNPSALINVVRQAIRDLEAGRGIPEFNEKNTQLKEIARTISNLEAGGVSVPESLRALKMDLVADLSAREDAEKMLSCLEFGLNECLDEIRRILGKTPAKKEKKPKSNRKSGKKTTSRAVLREHIIKSLHVLGGSAHITDVLDQMGKDLEGKLLPGDLEKRKTGDVVWRNNSCWERFRMVTDGILKANSPKGIWELSEGHR